MTNSVTEMAIEILRATNDGNELSPHHLKLVELAVNGFLNEAGTAAFEDLYGNATKPAGYTGARSGLMFNGETGEIVAETVPQYEAAGEDENFTEFICCEHCGKVFDHDSAQPGSFHCPYCHGDITDASQNVEVAYAIYGLDAIGVNRAYEATGEVHWYCSESCASAHAIAEGRTSANYSEPQVNPDALDGTTCERCGKDVNRKAVRS